MHISKFTGDGVHGYLSFEVNFNTDVTFIIGINGSGKTTVLKLIQALLTPDIYTLCTTVFSNIELLCRIDDRDVYFSAISKDDLLTISVSDIQERLIIRRIIDREVNTLHQKPDDVDNYARLIDAIQPHAVIQYIKKLSSPMFLGLDRRTFEIGGLGAFEEPSLLERRIRSSRSANRISGSLGASLAEVQVLAIDYMRCLRAQQEKLGNELRESIILAAFQYETLESFQINKPTEQDIYELERKKNEIISAANSLGVNPNKLDNTVTPFFNNMSNLTRIIMGNKDNKNNRIAEWLVNKLQVSRIDILVKQIESYHNKEREIFENIERLKQSVNLFFGDSGKQLVVTPGGELAIELPGQPLTNIQALSSGERQIVVMLAQITFNEQASSAGVFIVDEPELSLHLAWQESFVDAVHKIAPMMQIIMATHAPSIVRDRHDKCIDLTIYR